ncbi:MAG: hypothetical protein ACYCYO_08630 [Bacilli bacterium]
MRSIYVKISIATGLLCSIAILGVLTYMHRPAHRHLFHTRSLAAPTASAPTSVFWENAVNAYLHSLSAKTAEASQAQGSVEMGFIKREERAGFTQNQIVANTSLLSYAGKNSPPVVVATVTADTMAMHILSQRIYTYSSGGVVVQPSSQVLGRTAAPDYQDIKLGTVNGKDALVTGFSNSNGPCRVQFDLWNHQGGWRSIWTELFYGVSDVTLTSVRAFHLFGDNPRQIWTLSEAHDHYSYGPQPYVASIPYLYITPQDVKAGEQIWVTGWVPQYANRGRFIELSWNSASGISSPWKIPTAANGTFRVLETVPQQTPQGSYTLTALLARTGNGMVLLENFVNISAHNKP